MNLPNKLTMLRVILIPFFCVFLCMAGFGWQVIATVIFLIASVTDLLDGYIARRDNLVTDFGKLVDPIADKLLITSAMIFMVAQGRMSAAVVLIFVAREFIVSAFRMLAASRGTVIAADKLGKYKTATQTAAIVLLMLFKPLGDAQPIAGTFGMVLADIVTWAALVLSILSCADYIYKNRSIIDRQL